MELKRGYRQTDIGVIPEDWDCRELSELTSLMTNGFVGTVKSQYTENDEGVIYIQGYNVEENSFNYRGIKRVTQEFHKLHLKSSLQEGDILTIQTGDVGLTTIVPKELVGSNCHALIISRFKKDKFHPKYYSFYLNSSHGRSRLKEIEIGTTMKHINVNDMLRFKVPIPTKLEQTAIANALSDADAYIRTLEKLIEKKNNIKQGAMQQLLKPKKGWNFVSLDKVVWYQEGPGVRNYQFTKSGVKLLNGTNIEKGQLFLDKTDRYISEHEAFGFYSHFLADEGDIIIACSGVTINKFDEKVTFVQREHLPLCMNTSTMRFKVINEKIDKYFFFHFLKSNSFKEQIGGKATGSAQLNFGPSHIKNVQISLPNLIEQKEISTILSDIDEDITLLGSKLLKYKLIKQGMMQNLLTGKIRLV
jgi:type I restriction enzyme S subunit